MSQFLKRFLYVYVANITILTTSVFASSSTSTGVDAAQKLDFSVDRTDASLQLLEQVFGLVDGVLYGTGTQVVGKMFAVFNTAVLALGGIFLTYTLLVSTINTAQDGEVMGKQWSSVWIPVRVTCGVGLLVPKASGYCMMQVFVMWVVVQGIGAANHVWGAALQYLEDGGVLSSRPISEYAEAEVDTNGDVTNNSTALIDTTKLDTTKNLLNSLVCMNALETSLRKWERGLRDKGISISEPVPDFFSTIRVKDHVDKDTGGTGAVSIPDLQTGFPSGSAYAGLHGKCGSYTMETYSLSTAEKSAITSKGYDLSDANSMESKAQEAIQLGTQQILDELNRTALVIVDRNNQQVSGFKEALSDLEDRISQGDSGEDISNAVTNAIRDFQNVDSVGRCQSMTVDGTPLECGGWAGPGGGPALLSGYELQTSILSYYALVMPFLNAMNRNKEDIEFIPKAKSQGWIMAGSYFFDMARLNIKLDELEPEKFFKVKSSGQPYTNDFTSNSPATKPMYDAVQSALTADITDDAQRASLNLMPLFENYIVFQTATQDGQTKATGGVTALWRVTEDNVNKYADDYLPKILDDLKARQGPTSIFIDPGYQSYFSFSNLIRMPYMDGPSTSGCSFWKFYKCFDDAIGMIIWNIIQLFLSAIFELLMYPFILIEQALDQTFGRLVDLGLKELFRKVTNADGHPIVNMATTGEDMMEFAWDTLLTMFGIMFVIAIIPALGLPAVQIFWQVIGKRIVAILMLFLVVFGYSFAFYAPLLPWMIFLFATLGWCLAVIEAMVAAPIVALGLTHPEGQNQVFGKAENAIMILINVFLRPSLMIIGFIIGTVLSYAFIQFAAMSFSKMNDTLMGVESNRGGGHISNAISAALQAAGDTRGTGKTGITGVLGPIMMLLIFMFIYMEIVKKCFSLTYLLPDQILRWLSGGVAEQFGSQTAGQMEQAVSQGYNKAEQQAAPTPKALDGVDNALGKMEEAGEKGAKAAGGAPPV